MAPVDAYTFFTGTATSPIQEVAQTATTTASTNYINLDEGLDAFGNILTNPDIGMGKPTFVNIICVTAPTAAGSGTTFTFALQSGPDAGGTGASQNGTCSSWTTIAQSAAIPIADFIAGYKFFMAVPPYSQLQEMLLSSGVVGTAQYLQVLETTGTSTCTGGYFSAWLSAEPLPTI